ncbi:nitrate reductase molybdenum cofactor assembly chaperone [Cellulomonas triticagri]|uniref:Nitrate reductase molybdenum cofactor assembly chaperone n=1 Tax=Cellulomonas triticagri TaxID=2483352 RepID=A0A3M2JAX6_9CELL|nr:nitrate reductase molybdenum cofactor assembly chaperone [Cellulomonas triticagri]RMI09346.1 nitrate reductase molybdenum cofactor assembly chaperone [Cellulomonas triticagri]
MTGLLRPVRRSRRRDLVAVPARADVLALAALLLAYPDDEHLAVRDDLGTAVAALPESAAAGHLRGFLDATAGWSEARLRRHHVETFDLRRSTSPYLTYYLHGDTRRRGAALLGLKQTYRAGGFVPPEDELPDHLPIVLEFAAQAGPGAGEAALRTHRAGFEVLRAELARRESPYRHVLDAVAAVLGPAGERVHERARAIIRAGPPRDDVGLGAPLPGYGSATPSGTPYPPTTCGSTSHALGHPDRQRVAPVALGLPAAPGAPSATPAARPEGP